MEGHELSLPVLHEAPLFAKSESCTESGRSRQCGPGRTNDAAGGDETARARHGANLPPSVSVTRPRAARRLFEPGANTTSP